MQSISAVTPFGWGGFQETEEPSNRFKRDMEGEKTYIFALLLQVFSVKTIPLLSHGPLFYFFLHKI